MSVRYPPLRNAAPRVGLSRPDHAWRAPYHEDTAPGGEFRTIRRARTSSGIGWLNANPPFPINGRDRLHASFDRERLLGYRDAFSAHNLPIPETLIFRANS